MAAFFGFQGQARGMKVVTIDRDHGALQCQGLLERLGMCTLVTDLMGAGAAEAMAALLSRLPHPLVLFCDNGDKPRECRSFAPLLAVGDYLAIHDGGSEITEDQLDPRLPMVMKSECQMVGSFTRFLEFAGVPFVASGYPEPLPPVAEAART